MSDKNLSGLTDKELLQKKKEMKNSKLVNAMIVGFTIGIFIYSLAKNGFGFFTFFPLIIAYLLVKNSANEKLLESEIEKEIELRNLK